MVTNSTRNGVHIQAEPVFDCMQRIVDVAAARVLSIGVKNVPHARHSAALLHIYIVHCCKSLLFCILCCKWH